MKQSPVDLPSAYDSILKSSNAKNLVYSEDINFLASYATALSVSVTDLNYTIWYNITTGYINVWEGDDTETAYAAQLSNF